MLVLVALVLVASKVTPLQGHLAHRKQPTLSNHQMALGIVLLKGAREALFLMSEVPL